MTTKYPKKDRALTVEELEKLCREAEKRGEVVACGGVCPLDDES